jgi:hypothetical protein
MSHVCVRCTRPAEDPEWWCCLECRLMFAEEDRNRRPASSANRDETVRRLLEQALGVS